MVKKTWLLAASTFAGLMLMTMLAFGSGSAVASTPVDTVQSAQGVAQVDRLAPPVQAAAAQQTAQTRQDDGAGRAHVEHESHEHEAHEGGFDD